MDFWNLPGVSRSLLQEENRRSQLNEHAERLSTEVRTRETIVRDLVEQRIDLTEAVNQLYHCGPLDLLRDAIAGMELPGDTEDERMAQLLIFWVRQELEEEPARAAQVVTRLEAQLQHSTYHQ
jgi:hypothetical protein